MAYFAEFGCIRGEDFYQEIVIFDANTGALLPGAGVDHQLRLYGLRNDYGHLGQFGQIVASDSNGLITQPEPGVIAISVPASSFFGTTDPETGVWTGSLDTVRRALRCRLVAHEIATGKETRLLTGSISFGDRLMPSPRLQLGTYPLYPAPAVPPVQVAQVKTELAKVPGRFDQVEAALLGPLDPATLQWNNGGPVSFGGPLASLIETTLGWNDTQMKIFLIGAGENPL